MRRLWSAGLSLVVCLGTLAFARVAGAVDGGAVDGAADAAGSDSGTVTPGAFLAYYCGEADLQCVAATGLLWKKTVQLPIAFDWDTGWIPDSFPELQVRFEVKVPAETDVAVGGDFVTTWPSPLTLAVPGDRYTGLLKFDYGLVVSALGKIDISILGYDINWQGPLPYVPQINFHVLGGAAFDPWAFKPKVVSASAFTDSVQLFAIDVLSLAGIPSQVASGGVKLKVKGELKATYWTEKINVTAAKPAAQVMPIAPITVEDGTTQHGYKEGAYVEYDVNPDGVVHYDGVIHLIPAFYISVLGQDFDMPVYDYPITIPIGDQDFNFDKIRVHVPLPDVPPLASKIYDFGQVDVGSSKKLDVTLSNVGEAKARAVVSVDQSMAAIFKVLSTTVALDPSKSEDIQIRFAPKALGAFSTTMTIASNDPDSPLQTVQLKGEAVPPGTAPTTGDDAGGDDAGFEPSEAGAGFYNDQQDGACGCRVVGTKERSTLPMWAGLALLGAAIVTRRRRAGN